MTTISYNPTVPRMVKDSTDVIPNIHRLIPNLTILSWFCLVLKTGLISPLLRSQ